MLAQELKIEEKSKYKENLHMISHVVDEILGHIQNDITKINTNMRDSISTNIKLTCNDTVFING